MNALPELAAFPARRAVDSPGQTLRLARRAADLLAGGEVLLLWGPLGAGKTLFIQGLCQGLGIPEEVTSPTFTLAARYEGRLVLHHLDFYRLRTAAELTDVGVEAVLDEVEGGGAVAAVEWPRLLLPLVPRRLELLMLPGDGAEQRLWGLRGAPALPPAWRRWLEEQGGAVC